MKPDYMVVDDDPTNNLLCKLILKNFDPDASVKIFLKPVEAINYINKLESENKEDLINPTTLFLDVNMPIMNGWEFLEEFEKLPQSFRETFSINILSSAIEDFAEEKKRYKYVKEFLSKPLKIATLQKMKPRAEKSF